MVDAVVEHDYEAHESDELNLKKGDIIHNITIKSGGWWEGTLQRLGKRGMFPDNFVKVLGGDKKTLNSAQSPPINKTCGRKCKVLFNYTALAEDELDLNVGDIIDITGEVEEGWWKGKLKNRVGVFPSNFVSLIGDSNENNSSSNDSLNTSKIIDETSKLLAEESKDASVNMSKTKENSSAAELNEHLPALPPKPSKEMCKVLYGYKAANEDELSLEEGDVITIITKDAQDPGWWKGELKGKIGVFPDNFVKTITPVEEAKPDRPTKATKGKESISKSSSSASVYSSSSSIAVSRKFSDSIRPCVSVKPLLPPPPPLKKPSLSPVDSGKQQSGSTGRLSDGDIKPSLIKQFEQEKSAKLSDVPTSASRPSVVNSVTSTTVQQSSKQQNMVGGGTRSEREQHHVASSGGAETKWTVIETSADTADGMSWSSSRQSYSVTSSNVITSSTSSSVLSSSSSMISGAGGERERELDLDLVSRSAMLTHPTASRAKVPKRRLPSTLLTREDSRESSEGEGMVNGNVEPSPPVQEKQANRPPWVEELKLNQAKKSQVGGGKTRVLIGGGSGGGDTGTSTGISTTSSTVSSEVSRVALRQVPITAQRPLSLQPGSRLLSNDHQLSDSSSSSITLSVAQWNQLCEKVSKLESEVEDQRREFGKTLKELMDTIEAQAHKQKKMLSDLERLTDLVTQV